MQRSLNCIYTDIIHFIHKPVCQYQFFLLLNISIGSKPKYPDRPGSTCDPVWVETAAFETFLKAMNKLSFFYGAAC